MTIKELQEKVDEINKVVDKHYGVNPSSEYNITRHVLKLGEEYGELCEAVLSQQGIQRQVKLDEYNLDDIKNELADVVITALTITRNMEIDIEEMIKSKLIKIEKRFSKNLKK